MTFTSRAFLRFVMAFSQLQCRGRPQDLSKPGAEGDALNATDVPEVVVDPDELEERDAYAAVADDPPAPVPLYRCTTFLLWMPSNDSQRVSSSMHLLLVGRERTARRIDDTVRVHRFCT